jgi:DNA-binding CsgD family transcriptional regulator
MSSLTAREREVVNLLVQGKRTSEIAAILCVSWSTVKTHIANARHKTDARTSCELAAKVAIEPES